MTFKEIIGCSSKLLGNFSKKKKDQHRKLKRLNISIGNSFPQHRQIENFENSGQRNNSLYPPSIMTMSDLSRSISNRSITFASVFDEPSDNRTTFDPDLPLENEDLVIVVPNKNVPDEPIVNNSNNEPYPFRSEIPLCLLSKSHSSTSINRSTHSRRKFLSHRAKQLRHPVKTVPSIDRSKSIPDILLSSSTTTTNNDHRSLKTIRQWFKSSSVGRLIQSFIKHPTDNTKSIPSRKYTDLIY